MISDVGEDEEEDGGFSGGWNNGPVEDLRVSLWVGGPWVELT